MKGWVCWLVIFGGGGLIEVIQFDCCGRFGLCGLPERLSSFSFSHGEIESVNRIRWEILLPAKRSVSMRESYCARNGTGTRDGT